MPWLFDSFEMLYSVDYEGRRLAVPSRRHSTDMLRDFEKMEPVLEERGAMVKGRIGDATVRVLEAAAMRDIMMPMLAEDPFLLLAASPRRPRAPQIRGMAPRQGRRPRLRPRQPRISRMYTDKAQGNTKLGYKKLRLAVSV